MTKEEQRDIERYLSDTLTERPHTFTAGDTRLALYPVTLGKMYRIQPHIENLGIIQRNIQKDFHFEAMRLVKGKRDVCLTILSYHTLRKKEELDDVSLVERRKDFLGKQLSDEEIAALMVMVLSSDRTNLLIHHFGIDKEIEDIRKVMEIKNKTDGNNFTFGGLTIYGSFIQPLIEMGLSWDEILWERSYTNLRMLLADKVNTVYVTDDERNKIRISRDRIRVDGDDRNAMLKAIRSESWE